MPVHGWYRVVANVIADADSAVEQFNSQVFWLSVIQQHSILLLCRKHHGHVRWRLCPQRLQLHKWVIVNEAETRQVLTSLSWTTSSDMRMGNIEEEEKYEVLMAVMLVIVLVMTMSITNSLNENYVVPCICLRAIWHMYGSMWRATLE